MSKFLWNSNLERKLHIFEIVILNATWKDCKSRKNLYTKYFTYTNKFYVHEIAAVNLSKIYFLKNAKRTCKPNNRDINRDWIIFNVEELMLFCCTQMLPFIKTKRNQKWEIPRLPNISSHRRCSVKKGVLKYFAKFTGKHLCQSFFFNNVAGLRTPFLQNTSERLLLYLLCFSLYKNHELELTKDNNTGNMLAVVYWDKFYQDFIKSCQEVY